VNKIIELFIIRTKMLFGRKKLHTHDTEQIAI